MNKLPFYAALGTVQALATCCGVHEVGSFDLDTDFDGNPTGALHYGHAGGLACSGSGLFVSTFINEPASKQAYEELCREHVLLYQSPLRVNSGSGNRLFLCVFMHKTRKGKVKKDESASNGWPGVTERAGEKLPRF